MKHAKRVGKILIRVEFDFHGRTAYSDAEIDLDLLSNPLKLRELIDLSIDKFFAEHPVIKN